MQSSRWRSFLRQELPLCLSHPSYGLSGHASDIRVRASELRSLGALLRYPSPGVRSICNSALPPMSATQHAQHLFASLKEEEQTSLPSLNK
jgi:hypothetical protein